MGQIDWNRLNTSRSREPEAAIDLVRRLRVGLALFVVLLLIIFGRLVYFEITQGPGYREVAARPIEKDRILPGKRGRMVSSDGVVLAEDRPQAGLAVHYRYFEEPTNSAWLRSMALARLDKASRRDSQRVEAEMERVREEITQLRRRLTALAGEGWQRRAIRAQTEVRQIRESVNRRHRAKQKEEVAPAWAKRSEPLRKGFEWFGRLAGSDRESFPSEITVREELQYHRLADELTPEAIREIETHPERFPGVMIESRTIRDYPRDRLAANVVGHVGKPPESLDTGAPSNKTESLPLVGLLGLESQYEKTLRGKDGRLHERTTRHGQILSQTIEQQPTFGRDLVLTIDSRLQAAAEELLDRALIRRSFAGATPKHAGGAVLVMDVETGAILTAATGPRFDPNQIVYGTSQQKTAILDDPAKPLFDRTYRMAIPPGSVFKTLTAVALLQEEIVTPETTFDCRGYLHDPDRMRCAIYTQTGEGHGTIRLFDALAESCNVFFFHFTESMEPYLLIKWAFRFGFGLPTGIDLPFEPRGNLPMPEAENSRPWTKSDTQMLSIGQGRLQTTPVTIGVMMAAVANGGRKVTPHVVSHFRTVERGDSKPIDEPIEIPTPSPIPDLKPETLETVRSGLREAVAFPKGTAHETVWMAEVAVAGKTGTAQSGIGLSDHAWFAGYFPADRPKYVIVVVLEHSGSGGEVAGPVVKQMVLEMRRLGLL